MEMEGGQRDPDSSHLPEFVCISTHRRSNLCTCEPHHQKKNRDQTRVEIQSQMTDTLPLLV